MNWRRRLRPLAFAVCVALGAAVAGRPADAVEAPPGSANFTPPAYVPNYFSNESGPLHGGAAARTQPGAGPSPDGRPLRAVPGIAASSPRRGIAAAPRRYARHHPRHATKPRGRVRLAHGRASAHRHVVHTRMARSSRASAHRHLVHARMVRNSKASAHRHVVHAEMARRGKPSRARVAHPRTRPAKSKAVAARRRPAPNKGKRVARARG